jgi:hypothetical protein
VLAVHNTGACRTQQVHTSMHMCEGVWPLPYVQRAKQGWGSLVRPLQPQPQLPHQQRQGQMQATVDTTCPSAWPYLTPMRPACMGPPRTIPLLWQQHSRHA